MTDFYHELDELRAAPSEDAWERELAKVIGGDREHILIQVGGADAYVDSMLSRSSSPEDARRAFQRALLRTIEQWRPEAPVPSYAMAHTLELIGAYVPVGGFEKLLGHIMRWSKADIGVVDRGVPHSYGDLHERALFAVSQYVHAPPLSLELLGGFRAYIRMLRQHLHQPTYSGFAARRLYELGEIRLDGPEVDAALSFPQIIAPLVQAILSPVRRYRQECDRQGISDELSRLVQTCQRANASREVFNAVRAIPGFTTENKDGPAVVYRYEGDLPIILNVTLTEIAVRESLEAPTDQQTLDQAIQSALARPRSSL